MTIGYNWTCTACGVGNPTGTDICRKCGSNAVTSAVDIEIGSNTRRDPPLSVAERLSLLLLSIVFIAGVALLEIFNPSETAWWIGVGLVSAGLILGGAGKWLRRRK